jgi:hypothetical protein
MTATTLAGIDAGARGVLYYDWVGGTRDYDFWVGWPLGDIRSMVNAGRTRLAVRSAERPRPSVAIRHPKVVPFAGRGERDPGRFMLLYKALKSIRPHVRILTPGEPDPPGMPVFTVADVPDRMHPIVHRSTEAKETGNTPPLFKFLGNEALVAELAGILERRLAAER